MTQSETRLKIPHCESHTSHNQVGPQPSLPLRKAAPFLIWFINAHVEWLESTWREPERERETRRDQVLQAACDNRGQSLETLDILHYKLLAVLHDSTKWDGQESVSSIRVRWYSMDLCNSNLGTVTDNWTILKGPRKGNGRPIRGADGPARGTEGPATGTGRLLIARNPFNCTRSSY